MIEFRVLPSVLNTLCCILPRRRRPQPLIEVVCFPKVKVYVDTPISGQSKLSFLAMGVLSSSVRQRQRPGPAPE